MVVAHGIARALEAPLDVLVARKLGAPVHPELGIGAIAPGGVRVLDERLVEVLHISDEYIREITAHEMAELDRRLRRFRDDRPFPLMEGRTVILVDDGVATGVTARAAIMFLKLQAPKQLIFAVPVCSDHAARLISPEVDRLLCLHAPSDFKAVGLWYDNFAQTTDEEVSALLEDASRRIAERSERRADA